METHRLVLPSDLNHYGHLFGGRLLAWVDEACWIAASLDFPHCQFVTIGMDKIEFLHGVHDGTILNIQCCQSHRGQTSTTYTVKVTAPKHLPQRTIFTTSITYVSIDDSGKKTPI